MDTRTSTTYDFDKITRPILRNVTVGRLREWLDQFPYDSDVWVGNGCGYSNQAMEAWKLGKDDVLIDIRQMVVKDNP